MAHLSRLSAAALAALHAGRKIEAIKLVREETGMDLTSAHDLIEAQVNEDPQLCAAMASAAAAKRRRAMPALIFALVLVLVAAYVVFA